MENSNISESKTEKLNINNSNSSSKEELITEINKYKRMLNLALHLNQQKAIDYYNQIISNLEEKLNKDF